MHQTIAHGCFVDVAGFWVIDAKGMIGSVPVGFRCQFRVKRDRVIDEMQGESRDIDPISLPAQKLLPCRKQIFQ